MRLKVALFSFALLVLGMRANLGLAADATYSLREERAAGSLQRVQVEFEVEGKLKLNATGKQVSHLPLAVKATLAYDERVLPLAGKATLRRVRHYHQGLADIRVGNEKQTTQLRESARLVYLRAQADDVLLFAPGDTLSREELELLEVPGNSSLLAGLLPPGPVKVGDTWQPTSAALAPLLNIEMVLQNQVQCTLKSVTEDTAKLELTGKVDGSAAGISTSFELSGKLTFDRAARQCSWFALSLKENRAIGHAEPGYEVSSQVKVLMAPLSESDELTDQVAAAAPTEIGPGHTLLRFESQRLFIKLHLDRRWRMMIDRPDLAVCRFVDRGDLVAQCNITRLSPLPADKSLALESFQQEVKAALDKNVEQFVEANASTTSSGLRVLRVSAVGKVAELPIYWVYYHVSNAAGRRVSCVFTLEQKLMERFGGADEALVSTLEFLPEPAPTTADPAPASAADDKTATGTGPAEKDASAAPSAIKKPASSRR